MKKADWFRKNWRAKLNEIPVHDSADAAWRKLSQTLDTHLPVNSQPAAKLPGKAVLQHFMPMAGYVVSAAIAVAATVYFLAPGNGHHPVVKKNKAVLHLKDSTAMPGSVNKNDILSDSTLLNYTTADSGIINPAGKQSLQSVEKTDLQNSGGLSGIKLKTDTSYRLGLDNREMIKKRSSWFEENQTHHVSPGNILQAKHKRPTSNAGTMPKENPVYVVKGETSGHEFNNAFNKSLMLPEASSAYLLPIDREAPAVYSSDLFTRTKDPHKKYDGKQVRPVAGKKTGKTNHYKNKGGSKGMGSLDAKYNYYLESGVNIAGASHSIYGAFYGSYKWHNNWQLAAGVRMIGSSQAISGKLNFRSYYPRDSVWLTVTDKRKLTTLQIPVNIIYQLNKRISLYAGPQINLVLKQVFNGSKLDNIINSRDTLGHTNSIDSTLRISHVNKLNIGVNAGVRLRLGDRLFLNGTFQRNITPIKVTTGFGSYQQHYQSLQLGISFRLNK